MPKKKEEFDFDKSYDDLMEQAKASGMDGDMIFQTLMREYRRMRNVCDKLYENIEESGVTLEEIGVAGQKKFKSNPLVKEYVSAHKTLVTTCASLKEFLAKVGSNGDWL